MRNTLFLLFLIFTGASIEAQPLSQTFEIRYFTNDPNANGETDFKGETEWMNTNQRIHFLNDYANYASRFFGDTCFDKKIVYDKEVKKVIDQLKPQPLTSIRRTIPLNLWKAYGYKEGEEAAQQKELDSWKLIPGVTFLGGTLCMNNSVIDKKIDSLNWRFRFEAKIDVNTGKFILDFNDRLKSVIYMTIKNGEITVVSAGKTIRTKIAGQEWMKLVIEGDFTKKRFNLIVDGNKLFDYIPMADTTLLSVTGLSFKAKGRVKLDDLLLTNYIPTTNVSIAYTPSIVLDENFENKPNIDGWQKSGFDDSLWKTVDLPAVHGGIREKEEDYYLRKTIRVGSFERATLQIETIDPGGEVWVNNQVVAVVNNRRPVNLDITHYLIPDSENQLSVRVKHYKMNNPMHHSPADRYTGWFMGRTKLLLTNNCMIRNVFAHTASVGDSAIQANHIVIQYNGSYYFKGNLEINYYPWFPEDGDKVASFNRNIEVRPCINNEYEFDVPVPDPCLWSCDSPFLYKLEVILKDQNGKPVDDFVTTTGIRTLDQKNGEFLVNGKPEMLNGAQIMGFRMPYEDISKNSRCAPNDKVAEEMLMIKKMGNLLRIHVHAEKDTTDGINDPRYAEIADQLGIYLIWQTAGWEREGDAWHVDFEGYPQYIRQVYNHPSIVIWEAANHPNRFKKHDFSDTQDYVKKIYNVIYNADSSRLISPTSFWQHTYYANYNGTIDYKGNKIKAVPEFMASRNTRGSQDAYSGYSNDWSVIRKAPNDWAASCLNAKDKAYFNFEHEESIGQPNWNLCKGKPWYLLQSYEWTYDEGTIGRKLTSDEWKASQAWQAFSAWESMKKQILLGYDGFSWCTLHGGANSGTYKKPLIDNLGHPKLAYYVNKMIFQRTWAGSNNVDVVYGPEDSIIPVINHLGKNEKVDLLVQLKTLEGKIIDKKIFKNIELKEGHSIKELNSFKFQKVNDGIYVIIYSIKKNEK